MRRLRPLLAAFTVSAGLASSATADDRHDCQGASNELRITACTRILAANPMDFAALANRGVGYRALGEYDRALADFQEAFRFNSHSAGLYLERGLALDGKRDHAAAIADFDEALRRNPSLVVAYFARAMAYERTSRPGPAQVDLAEAMRRDPAMVAALYMQRGYALSKSRDFGGAVAAFNKAIDLNPNRPLAYFGRGASYEGMGHSGKAAADYRKTLELEGTTELERLRQNAARERLERLGRR